MSAKITSGTWKVANSLDNLQVVVERNGNFCRIASVHCYGHHIPNYDESEANARLIAKAPAMLETLKKVESFLSGFEGDETQEGIGSLILNVRKLIR